MVFGGGISFVPTAMISCGAATYLVEEEDMDIDDALTSFKHKRPPGIYKVNQTVCGVGDNMTV